MAIENNALDTLLNEHQVARHLNISVGTIRRYRLLNRGPKYLKLNAAVRYKVSDLEAWLASRPVGGSVTQPDPAGTAGRVRSRKSLEARNG